MIKNHTFGATIQITAPNEGEVFTSVGDVFLPIPISAEVDGAEEGRTVQFFANGVLIPNTAPTAVIEGLPVDLGSLSYYTTLWTPSFAPAGGFLLTVVVTDSKGRQTLSNKVRVYTQQEGNPYVSSAAFKKLTASDKVKRSRLGKTNTFSVELIGQVGADQLATLPALSSNTAPAVLVAGGPVALSPLSLTTVTTTSRRYNIGFIPNTTISSNNVLAGVISNKNFRRTNQIEGVTNMTVVKTISSGRVATPRVPGFYVYSYQVAESTYGNIAQAAGDVVQVVGGDKIRPKIKVKNEDNSWITTNTLIEGSASDVGGSGGVARIEWRIEGVPAASVVSQIDGSTYQFLNSNWVVANRGNKFSFSASAILSRTASVPASGLYRVSFRAIDLFGNVSKTITRNFYRQ